MGAWTAGLWSRLRGRGTGARGRATAFIGRGYNASQIGRRLAGWRAERRTINSLLATGGEELRARARQLVRENPYGANACDAYTAAAVGSGVKPSSLHPDRDTRKAIQTAFRRWTDEADADGLTDFYGLQALAARAMFEAGECFIRFRPRLPKDGLTVPLQLQLYESEMLSFTKNETAPNGNVIREGIEFDALGRRVAYWFYKSHPGELYPVIFDFSYNRVPASEVMHLYRPLRPGQIRGQPQLTPSMIRLYLLDQYDDAELDRKKVAALFVGFVTKKSADAAPPFDTERGFGFSERDEIADPGSAIVPMEPGQLQVLDEGESVTFSSPTEVGGSYEAFMWRNLVAIAAGCGVPYAAMTGDVSQSNYSSERAAQVEFRRRMDQFQHQTLVFQMMRPVWQRWFTMAVLSGAIPITPKQYAAARRDMDDVKWIPPAWDWVDPLKDGKAFELAQNSGWTARSDIIEARGEEPEDTDARIQADREREVDMDLGFRPVTIRENVNIAANAANPDAAVEAARDGGDTADDPEADRPPDPKARSGAARSGGALARARAQADAGA